MKIEHDSKKDTYNYDFLVVSNCFNGYNIDHYCYMNNVFSYCNIDHWM